MNIQRWLIGVSLVSLGLMVGCSSTDSNVVDTAGVFAELEVNASGDGQSEVVATLHVGSAGSTNFLKLAGGDALRAFMIHATTGGETQATMDEHAFGGATWYNTTFSTQEADTGFRVEFDRGGTGKKSALSSTATLPTPFVLSSKSGATTFSRTDTTEFLAIWDPFDFTSGDILTYNITGACIESSRGGIDWATDDSLQLAKGFLISQTGRDQDSCSINVELTLAREGTVDSAYGEGGTYTAKQTRTLSLTADP